MALTFAAFAFCLGPAKPATALTPPEEMVEKSRLTLQKLIGHPDVQELKRYLAEAKGVFIVPSLIKGAFIVGAEGGSGVLLVKGADGTWSSPAFYNMAGGSIGLQIGGQVSEVVLTIMNDEALRAILEDKFKMGGDLSIAVGPIGAGIEAGTTSNFDADVYAFSHAVGLFGGGSLEGSAIFINEEDNQTYYGNAAPAEAILLERRFNNPQSEPLRKLLP